MKKVLLIVSSTLLLANTFIAQETENDKKFRFGLKVTPTPTWLRSGDNKFVERSGAKFGFGFGLQTEFRINSTASFVTGIGGDFLGGKQNYKNGQGYVLTKDNEYIDSKETGFGGTTFDMNANNTDGRKFYEIKSRSIKTTYVTIPILLKLMTKDISGFKYFGMFGGNIAVQTKFRATDEITELKYNLGNDTYEANGTSTITDMKPSGDLIPVNVGLNVGLGLEYNLSGNTSVFISINYLRGFINQYQPKSEIMVDRIKDNLNMETVPPVSKQSAFTDGIQINLGVLF
ncbi:MAG: outer membrane beta-barrel protein [Bacteroidota bacterium]